MSYEFGFLDSAWKEWHGLDGNTRALLKKALAERGVMPHAPAFKLPGPKNHYKIKSHGRTERLVYEVREEEALIVVAAIWRSSTRRAKSDPTHHAPRS